MWKYIAAVFFFIIGCVELLLAVNGNLRETLLKNSMIRSKRAEPTLLFIAGLSAIAIGIGILFYHLYW
ncbi:MAG: hypothetical protein QOJ02_1815 [Acidobacteriota bacterium]|jgi:hypothetical protein|nr:hypothetical protein [Acidobacteriota bacterium]